MTFTYQKSGDMPSISTVALIAQLLGGFGGFSGRPRLYGGGYGKRKSEKSVSERKKRKAKNHTRKKSNRKNRKHK